MQLSTVKREERISIHALRVEGDDDSAPPYVLQSISIHALRVEGDTAI